MDLIQKGFSNADYIYRTEFQIPETFTGRRVWLNFEGISRDAIIFVNGKIVGKINGAWTRGKFDISAIASIGQKNALAVLIRKGTASSDNPETDKGQGFSGHNIQGNECHPAIPGDGNGIYAEVYLTGAGKVRINDPFVESDLPIADNSLADLAVKAEMENL